MTGAIAFFVSKRQQRQAAALLCLMAAQLLVLASCQPEPTPMAAKVALSR